MAGKTPRQIVRDMDARNAALRRYAAAHDHFSTIEQLAEHDAEREGAHQHALWILRAYRAELDDPEPRKPQ